MDMEAEVPFFLFSQDYEEVRNSRKRHGWLAFIYTYISPAHQIVQRDKRIIRL